MIILFDLDGTLIDSTEAILEGFHNAFDVYDSKHPSDEDIKQLIGYPLDKMFADLGVQEEYVWDYVATYKNYYKEIATAKTELLPYAKEAVIQASKIATLGIVTTKTGLYSQEIMEHFGLMQYFEVLIGREHVTNPKPDAEPINKALESILLKVPKESVWMIGDTKLDLISAHNAKVNSIGVTSGYDSQETLEKYTDNIYTNALEAIEFLNFKK